jgi:hypothetical protein
MPRLATGAILAVGRVILAGFHMVRACKNRAPHTSDCHLCACHRDLFQCVVPLTHKAALQVTAWASGMDSCDKHRNDGGENKKPTPRGVAPGSRQRRA